MSQSWGPHSFLFSHWLGVGGSGKGEVNTGTLELKVWWGMLPPLLRLPELRTWGKFIAFPISVLDFSGETKRKERIPLTSLLPLSWVSEEAFRCTWVGEEALFSGDSGSANKVISDLHGCNFEWHSNENAWKAFLNRVSRVWKQTQNACTTTHLVPSQNLHTQPGQDRFAFAISYTISQGPSMVAKSKSLLCIGSGTWRELLNISKLWGPCL